MKHLYLLLSALMVIIFIMNLKFEFLQEAQLLLIPVAIIFAVVYVLELRLNKTWIRA